MYLHTPVRALVCTPRPQVVNTPFFSSESPFSRGCNSPMGLSFGDGLITRSDARDCGESIGKILRRIVTRREPDFRPGPSVAGLSPFHFARMFTLAIGVPPHRYVSRMRLENATAEIAAGRSPLAPIAFDAGFSSQASFTRAFCRATGMTPGEYRRRLR
jgi:hypothetical protein